MTDQRREGEIRRRVCNHAIPFLPKQDGHDLLSLLDAALQRLAERDATLERVRSVIKEWREDVMPWTDDCFEQQVRLALEKAGGK